MILIIEDQDTLLAYLKRCAKAIAPAQPVVATTNGCDGSDNAAPAQNARKAVVKALDIQIRRDAGNVVRNTTRSKDITMRLQALFFLVFAGLLLGSCTTTTPSSGSAAATPPPSTQSPAASQQATAYSGLPTSRTAEGYHILGKADAPLTIVHYSDFL